MRPQRPSAGVFRSQLSRSYRPSGTGFESVCSSELAKTVTLNRVLAYENVSDASNNDDVFGGCSSCLSYTDDAELVAVAGPDCRVVVYDAATGKHKYAAEGHSEIVTGMAWVSPIAAAGATSRMFYTASLDKSIRLWSGSRHVATYRDHYDWIRSIAVSGDGGTLVSGCVSNNLFLWDTRTGRTICRTQAMRGLDEKLKSMPGSARPFCTSFEYSVNSVDFFRTNHNLFVSGTRDGTVRMWDCRDVAGGAVSTIFAHGSKLNQVQMGQADAALLTSGRDSVIRLWDTRMLGSSPEGNQKCLLTEFTGHKCRSYNISCTFFGSDGAVATGSEDNKVWVYDAKTGEVVRTLSGHGSVVHNIAAPRSQSHSLQLASSSIESSEVNVWAAGYRELEAEAGDAREAWGGAEDCFRRMSSLESHVGLPRGHGDIYESYGGGTGGEAVATSSSAAAGAHELLGFWDGGDEPMTDTGEADRVGGGGGGGGGGSLLEMHRSAIESLMRKHGDMILRVFHACDISFRTHLDWAAMIQRLTGREASGDPATILQGADVNQEGLAEAVREMAELFNAIADQQRGRQQEA